MSYIRTFTGREIDPQKPSVDDIDIRDIAHHLSMQCRWVGAVSKFYSVAEHSCIVANYVFHITSKQKLAFDGLMHDATEAYLQDLVRPLKRLCPAYELMELEFAKVIDQKFGCSISLLDERVKAADDGILVDEAAALMGSAAIRLKNWELLKKQSLFIGFGFLSPDEAEKAFLRLFDAYRP